MNKTLLIAIVCCVLPIAVVGFVLFSGGKRVDHSTMPGLNARQNRIVGTEVGNVVASFQLTDIDKKILTNNEFRGKPVIVWFTASYCVPCQIGAKEVRKLDNDMGGDAFNVAMVFIDSRESEQDLRKWKESFGNDDWGIAFGNEKIIQDYKIRFLDTQYLLDKEGVIQNVANSNVGYEAYKAKIQSLLQ